MSSSAEAPMRVFQAYPNGASLFERASGCLAASFFPLMYIVAPACVFLALAGLLVAPLHWITISLWIPVIVSAMIPPIPSSTLLQSWPFKYMPAYFDYSEICEVEDSTVKELMVTKRVMFVAQPHGVFTFGGACAGVVWGSRFWRPEDCPTAVADVIMKFPIIKHVVGIFGSCDASSKTLSKVLKKRSIVLYAGGIAELFLTDDAEERLYVNKRKGFVKVALQSGAAIVPLYIMGNTTTLKVAKGKTLAKLARTMGMSLTWFWGVWGTFVPRPRKVLVVVGKPMDMPQMDNPDQASIDKYHQQYIEEVKRLFDSYKKYNSDYAHKELLFAE